MIRQIDDLNNEKAIVC